jgi:hypothetical protein
MMAAISPLLRSVALDMESGYSFHLIPSILFNPLYTGLRVSEPGARAMEVENPRPPPSIPNTRMKMRGKAKPKITDEGLRNIACRLALIRARAARRLLY